MSITWVQGDMPQQLTTAGRATRYVAQRAHQSPLLPLLAQKQNPSPFRPIHPPGQIGYALCPMIAAGRMLGPDQPVILHLLDIPPAAAALEGVKMELLDAAFPLLQGEV
jgi:hypothetical protein